MVRNGLHTIEGSKDDIPIVIQSFDLDALLYFRTLADLPMTLVFGVDRGNNWLKIRHFFNSIFYTTTGNAFFPDIPDWEELSKIVSGISPFHHMMTKPNSPMDPMCDRWSFKRTKNNYTDLARLCHSLGIAVHPWPLQDDRLVYRKTAYAET